MNTEDVVVDVDRTIQNAGIAGIFLYDPDGTVFFAPEDPRRAVKEHHLNIAGVPKDLRTQFASNQKAIVNIGYHVGTKEYPIPGFLVLGIVHAEPQLVLAF